MIKKRLVKKITAIAITGALTIAMTASVLAAPGGPGGNGGPGSGSVGGGPSQEMQQGPGSGGDFNPGGSPGGGVPMGQMPEMPSGEATTGEMSEMPSGEAPTGEMPEMPSGEAPTGEMPEMPSGEAPTGERPEMPSGEAPTGEKPNMKGGNAGRGEQNRPGMGMKGINTDSIKTSIEALEDEDTKTALETLLSEYESAKTALDTAIKEKSDDVDTLREAEKTAMEALNTALKEAGIDTRPERPDNKGMKGINTDDIKTSIEALEDGDTKTNLETLLSEYESAKAALDTAIEEGADDVDTLREAEMKAMEALRTALEEAGIDARPQLPEGEGNGDTGMGQRPEKPADDDGSDMPSEKPAMQQSGAANNGTNAPADNIFARFGKWFMSLF